MLRIALAQMTSSPRIESNLSQMLERVREAKERGAAAITFPEMSLIYGVAKPQVLEFAALEAAPALRALAEAAKSHEMGIHLGSLPLLSPSSPEQVTNTSVVFAPDGSEVGRYHKVHLFDADVPGDRSYRESETYLEGSTAESDRVIEWMGLSVGLSICYDLRFPELYRLQKPVDLWMIPAAFTVPTGNAHWHSLVRARAIENLCYVIAPAQWGIHSPLRTTYGHSLGISPWGEVLADLDEKVGIELIEIDIEKIKRARNQIPSLSNRRI